MHAHILSIFSLVCGQPLISMTNSNQTHTTSKLLTEGTALANPSQLMTVVKVDEEFRELSPQTDLNDQLHTQTKLIPDRNCRVLKTTTT